MRFSPKGSWGATQGERSRQGFCVSGRSSVTKVFAGLFGTQNPTATAIEEMAHVWSVKRQQHARHGATVG